MAAGPAGPGGSAESARAAPIRWLEAWVGFVLRRARAVLVVTGLLCVAALVYAFLELGIVTSHTALLSDDLPFWEDYQAYAEVFPILDEALLVVVDAESPTQARRGADALAERLSAHPDDFESVYVPGGGAFFERHALLYLDLDQLGELADHLASVQPVLAEMARDRSLRNLSRILRQGIEHAEEEGQDFVDLSAVFDSLASAAQAVIDGRSKPVSWTDMLVQPSLTGESARRVVIAHPVFDYGAILPGRVPMQQVRDAARELGLVPERGFRVRITGNVALNTEEMLTVVRSGVLAAGVSILLVGVILYAALRSRRLVLALLVTLLEGLAFTAAFAALAVGHLNIVSIACAVLFIGLGIDFGIHLGMRYVEGARTGAGADRAIREAVRSVGGSLLLCALTTALGFYVFVPTDYRAIGELGLISGTGMLISLLSSLTVLPALLSRMGTRDLGSPWRGSALFERVIARTSLARPGAVRGAALVLGLGALALCPRAHFDHNVVAMRDAATESVQTFEELLAESRTSPWSIDVVAEDLAAAERLASRLRELPEVERAVTLSDYVPTDQEEKLEILSDLAFFLPEPASYGGREEPPPVDDQIASLRSLQTTLSDSWIAEGDSARAESARDAARHLDRFLDRLQGGAAGEAAVADLQQSLTGELPDQMRRLWLALGPAPVTLETLPGSLRSRMRAPDGRARIEVLPAEDLGDNAAHARFVDGVRALVPGATGSAVSLLEWARAVVRSFQQALLSALLAITVLLLLLWRRLGDVALVLAPLLLAAVLTVASAVLLGIGFNFANVVVLPLLLGIGVDTGIHMVHRYREVAARHPDGVVGAHELLGTSTPQAVLFSALTTLASFGSLTLSNHMGFRSLGQLLVIGVAWTLLCNLIVLPALLASRPMARERELDPPVRASA